VKYALLLITHGDAPHRDEVLRTFSRLVAPQPDVRLAVVDGPGVPPPPGPWRVRRHAQQEGFCAACRTGWDLAREAIDEHDLTHVFWLEHDFRFLRPVYLERAAEPLDAHPYLAQMALMRQPVNDAEVAAGGIIPSRPEATWERWPGWIEHREFWTTNPALIPAHVIRDYGWPDGDRCEGRFGIHLREQGLSFGFWGDGSVYVEHVGTRDGKGY
jgi:hypothetical protein